MEIVRLHFSKVGDVKYISHLDVNRCFARALVKSKANVWYTEGFNSHIRLQFALPLALGFESLCETVDLKVSGMDLTESLERVNQFLPKGLEIFNISSPVHGIGEISTACYYFELYGELPYRHAFCDVFAALVTDEEFFVDKKGKRGFSRVNIKPQIHRFSMVHYSDRTLVEVSVDAGARSNLNPMLIFDKVIAVVGEKPVHYNIIRMRMRTAEGEIFK